MLKIVSLKRTMPREPERPALMLSQLVAVNSVRKAPLRVAFPAVPQFVAGVSQDAQDVGAVAAVSAVTRKFTRALQPWLSTRNACLRIASAG